VEEPSPLLKLFLEPEAHQTKLSPLREPGAETLPLRVTFLSARRPANTTGEFPVSCHPHRSDSSASLAPTPLFHPSSASFNGAPPCCARAPPSPLVGAPKPLITPLTVKIKRSVPVRCFNLRPPIMKPALQIGSPLIKSQPPHSRSTITIGWGGYPFGCLNP
jgi:hypothetical protein